MAEIKTKVVTKTRTGVYVGVGIVTAIAVIGIVAVAAGFYEYNRLPYPSYSYTTDFTDEEDFAVMDKSMKISDTIGTDKKQLSYDSNYVVDNFTGELGVDLIAMDKALLPITPSSAADISGIEVERDTITIGEGFIPNDRSTWPKIKADAIDNNGNEVENTIPTFISANPEVVAAYDDGSLYPISPGVGHVYAVIGQGDGGESIISSRPVKVFVDLHYFTRIQSQSDQLVDNSFLNGTLVSNKIKFKDTEPSNIEAAEVDLSTVSNDFNGRIKVLLSNDNGLTWVSSEENELVSKDSIDGNNMAKLTFSFPKSGTELKYAIKLYLGNDKDFPENEDLTDELATEETDLRIFPTELFFYPGNEDNAGNYNGLNIAALNNKENIGGQKQITGSGQLKVIDDYSEFVDNSGGYYLLHSDNPDESEMIYDFNSRDVTREVKSTVYNKNAITSDLNEIKYAYPTTEEMGMKGIRSFLSVKGEEKILDYIMLPGLASETEFSRDLRDLLILRGNQMQQNKAERVASNIASEYYPLSQNRSDMSVIRYTLEATDLGNSIITMNPKLGVSDIMENTLPVNGLVIPNESPAIERMTIRVNPN